MTKSSSDAATLPELPEAEPESSEAAELESSAAAEVPESSEAADWVPPPEPEELEEPAEAGFSRLAKKTRCV